MANLLDANEDLLELLRPSSCVEPVYAEIRGCKDIIDLFVHITCRRNLVAR